MRSDIKIDYTCIYVCSSFFLCIVMIIELLVDWAYHCMIVWYAERLKHSMWYSCTVKVDADVLMIRRALKNLFILHLHNIWVFPKFQLISKIWEICLIFLPINSQTEKRQNVWILSDQPVLALSCLTSVIWPFTLTAFTFGSCLYCANVTSYKGGWAVTLTFCTKG